jgi:hypothetical protein
MTAALEGGEYNRNTVYLDFTNKSGTSNNTISKLFRKYISKLPGKHYIKDLHKAAILYTAHIRREVLA